MRISQDAIREGYKVARRVYQEGLSKAAAINELEERLSLNRNSAKDIIDNIGYMLKGERYERKNSTFATEHFLKMILHDFGREKLNNALTAVEKHLDYYESVPKGSKQPSIRRVVERYRRVAKELASSPYLAAGEADTSDAGALGAEPYRPTSGDSRERVMRQIRDRRGQREFRDALRRRYGEQCMISGCALLDVVEAAHIKPYRGTSDNHPENGLLLRADLHTLFDLDLLGIDPSTLRVRLHPDARRAGYNDFENERLKCPVHQPSEEALRLRWEAFAHRPQSAPSAASRPAHAGQEQLPGAPGPSANEAGTAQGPNWQD
jgi:hypothetical protein